MSNDNNQNENIKNDKFSLYIEKINPKKLKKKNKKLIALGILIGAGVAAVFIVPFIVGKVNHMVEVSNSELSLDSDDVQAINLEEINETVNVDNNDAFSKMPQTIESIGRSIVHITPKESDLLGQILSDKDEEDTENVRPSSGLIIGETATRFVIMSEGLSIDEEQNVDVIIDIVNIG